MLAEEWIAQGEPPETVWSVRLPLLDVPFDRLWPVPERFARYWLSRIDRHPWPLRRAIDPADIPTVLPHLMIWERADDRAGYRCRLAGTAVCAVAGRELRGCTLEAANPRIVGSLRADFDAVAAGGCLSLVQRRVAGSPLRRLSYQRLLVPVSTDGRRVDRLFGVIAFDGAGELPARSGGMAGLCPSFGLG